MSEPIIELVGVSKRFVKRVDPVARLLNRFGADYRESVLHAVEGVDLTVKPGEVLGLVGESGCGKSTLGRVVAGLLQPSAGEVRYHGRNVGELSEEQTRKYRMDIQIIFQDPYASLNPRRRVREIISEAPRIHGIWKKTEVDERLGEVMERVGLDPKVRDRYPHQFSGGQRQRIGIARAIAVDPGFIVCDEAVAALDVSIQAQILNLFMRLREEMGLTYLFISHDLGVIRHLSDRVAVMYLGRIVESNSAADLIAQPNHPYTQALLNEVPKIDDRQRDFPPVYGEIPSPLDPPSGCAYHPRCPHAFDRCRVESPELVTIAAGHRSACHLNERG